MSVDMEQAEPIGDVAQFDQEGYHLDLDVGGESNDINIQVEAFDTEVQYGIEKTGPENGLANQTDDFEIGFDEEDVEPDKAQEHHTESSHHQEVSADINVEYDDEIGYEDDEDDGNDGATGAATGVDSSAPQALSDQPKPDGEPQEANHEEFAPDQSYGDMSLHDDHAGLENGNDIAVLNGSTSSVHDPDLPDSLAVDKLGELASSNTEPGQTDGASGDNSELPYIEVLYKEARYSLFGTMDDDPDSFFVSEPKHLDIPLYEFLIAIRNVVEGEISPHDELTIRIPSLGLEFGERSRESFLRDYSLREIHNCWSHMFPNGVEETDYMMFHLVTCPEPQFRLDSLLADAGISHVSARSAAASLGSEDQGEIGFDEDINDGDSTRAYTETNVGNFEDNFEDNLEVESAAVSKADSGHSPVKVQASDIHEDEVYHGEQVGSPEEDAAAEEHGLERPDEEDVYFDEYQMADGDEVRDNIEDREFPEANDDVSPETGDHYGDDDILADVEVTATGETEVSVVGTGVETASEFYDDEINVDLGGDPIAAPQGASTEPGSHEAQEQNGYYDDDNAAPADQHESNHTSATSTIDGDEIDYEDNTAEDGDFTIDPHNDQELDLDVGGDDEIDWRNDEDEEETPVLPTAESPSSASVKRSRTDDADTLVDEADHKRRRT